MKAVWIFLVSDIVPECGDMIISSASQLGKGMAPPYEPEVKVRPDERKDYEHRHNLPRSGKQAVHMRARSFNLTLTLDSPTNPDPTRRNSAGWVGQAGSKLTTKNLILRTKRKLTNLGLNPAEVFQHSRKDKKKIRTEYFKTTRL